MIAALRTLGRAAGGTWDALVVLAVLNVTVLASVVLVVPLPAAVAALFAVTHGLAQGEEPSVAEFLRAVRRLFWRAWAWAGVNVAVGTVLWVGLGFYGQRGEIWTLAGSVVLGAAAFVWGVAQLFVWPYFCEDPSPGLSRALRNAVLTVLASPGFALTLGLAVAVVVALSAALVLPLAAVTGAFVCLTANHAVRDRLRAFGKVGVPA